MKLKKFLLSIAMMAFAFACPSWAQNVAKVGDTEYATIDEAIADWVNGAKTLTLLADVTLSDVVTIKSTEHHTLNLGTYTLTAAEGKDAFVIKACGTGRSERSALTINADKTNPGGINAGKKRIVYYKYADGGISTEDRPIITINGGVFTGSTSNWGTAGIYTIGTATRKCATLIINGGEFYCTILGSGKSKLIITGGVFHYSVGSQGDATCYRLISGGRFKTLGFMTADNNNTKFWFGTKMAVSNVGLYVDDEGYLVVGGPVITETSPTLKACATNYSKWSDLLAYSSAATNGLYYTNAAAAVAKHGAENVTFYNPIKTDGADQEIIEDLMKNIAPIDDEGVNSMEVALTEAGTTSLTFQVTPSETTAFKLPIPAYWKGNVNVYLNDETTPTSNAIKVLTAGASSYNYIELSAAEATKYTLECTDLTLVDGDHSKFLATRDVTVGNVTYQRTFSNNKWNALYLPFEVAAADLADFDLAYINDVHSTFDEEGGETMTYLESVRIKEGTLKANHPYLIRAKSGVTSLNLTQTNLFIGKSEENFVECSSVYNNYKVSGTYHTLTGSEIEGQYALTSGEWYKATSTATLNPFRLYMTITDREGNPLKTPLTTVKMFVRGEDDITGITDQLIETQGSKVIYDLQGRRVTNPAKGIYIVNGKKVYIK